MHLVPNVVTTLVAGVVYWILGAIWYAGLFGKTFQKACKLSEEEMAKAKKDFPKALVVNLITGIIIAYVLGRIVLVANATTIVDGIAIGLWVWVGFVLTGFLNAMMFERYPKTLFLVNNGFAIISYAVVGAMMAVWR